MRFLKRPVIVVMSVLVVLASITAMRDHLNRPDLDDLSREEYPFNVLKLPPMSINAEGVMDSDLHIMLKDAQGKVYEFDFPRSSVPGGVPFPEVLLTHREIRPPDGSVRLAVTRQPMKDPERAKAVCRELLLEYKSYHHMSSTLYGKRRASNVVEWFHLLLD